MLGNGLQHMLQPKKRQDWILKKILGYWQSNKAGFGAISLPVIRVKNSHAYWKLISLVQEEAEEEKISARGVQLKL